MLEAYIFKINNNLDKDEYEKLLQMVSCDKRERIGRFHRFEDAQRTLLGDILIRRIICSKLGISNNAINFKTNEYGKPFLPYYPNFYFNSAHSGDYIVCAVGDSHVGIDIEEIKQIEMTIAEHFFAMQETQYILSQPDEKRLKAFYQIWTMKEAYIKRDGKGLRIPLNSFNVLDPALNAFYHCILSNEKVVSHVCSEKFEFPKIIYFNNLKSLS